MDFLMSRPVVIFAASVAVFFCVYLHIERLLEFFKKQTAGAREEILSIMEKLLIQNQQKMIRRLQALSYCMALLAALAFWPRVLFVLVLSPLAVILSWQAGKFIFRALWEAHCNKVVNQLPEVLTIMCNSLKVGLSLPQAMDRVIKGYPGALAREFRLILNKTKLGMAVEEALTETGARINRPDIDMLVTAINILKETGGNLAETFDVMADTVRERQKMDKKIKALTAQGMMQAKILSAMPFILVAIFFVIDRDYIGPLVFTPLGWALLVIVSVLTGTGYIVMKKMVAIKV